MPEFLQPFGTESACCGAVLRARWPSGFVRPRCGGSAHCVLFSLGRPLFQCHACHRQTSLTAGTLFVSTKLSLTKWFLAIYRVSQAKTGLSALELKRHIEKFMPPSETKPCSGSGTVLYRPPSSPRTHSRMISQIS